MPDPICRIIRCASDADTASLIAWLDKRATAGGMDARATEDKVRAILDEVRLNGAAALLRYTRQFDCPAFAEAMLAVPKNALRKAVKSIPPEDAAVIREAARRIRAFHEAQQENSWFRTDPDGAILGQMVTPVERAGLYVPGGKAGETPLISSLLMNAVPARIAGVKEIAVISPPRADGTLNPHILAAAHILGITEVYAAGSAWGIAALAYGAGPIKAVDIIAGPGNIWVTTAKRLLLGHVGIDTLAGPSEICIIAGKNSNPAWIAADMLSQAEHDVLACAVCITLDTALAKQIQAELARQTAALPRAATAQRSLADWGAIVRVPDMRRAVALANAMAPEHLELCLDDPWAILPRIRNAGAVFMGGHAAEPVGDYFAGPNHVLPTMGTARFASALSVQTFCKKISVLSVSAAFTAKHGAAVARLARLEGLEAHARSIEARL